MGLNNGQISGLSGCDDVVVLSVLHTWYCGPQYSRGPLLREAEPPGLYTGVGALRTLLLRRVSWAKVWLCASK